GLKASGCNAGASVVVEKPFGRDLQSAKALNATLHRCFPESSIFRIDHYLGKEAVQNLIYFRFANTFLEPIWNRDHVRSVQLTMAEQIGIEGRGKFYEEVGAIRDVVQNHLLELVALLVKNFEAGEMTPYERLIGDGIRGDAMLFVREDEVETAWTVVEPVLGDATPVHEYAQETWGPAAAHTIAPPGGWHPPSP